MTTILRLLASKCRERAEFLTANGCGHLAPSERTRHDLLLDLEDVLLSTAEEMEKPRKDKPSLQVTMSPAELQDFLMRQLKSKGRIQYLGPIVILKEASPS
jgi:hypothetical protein